MDIPQALPSPSRRGKRPDLVVWVLEERHGFQQDQGAQWVVDHWLVIHRHELFAHRRGERSQACSTAAGKDDAPARHEVGLSSATSSCSFHSGNELLRCRTTPKAGFGCKIAFRGPKLCLHLGLVDEDPRFESLYWLELRHDIELASVADVSLKQAESSCSFTPAALRLAQGRSDCCAEIVQHNQTMTVLHQDVAG